MIANITEQDISVTVDFTGEEFGSINKAPKIVISSAYPGVGAVSVSTITATLQMGTADAAVG